MSGPAFVTPRTGAPRPIVTVSTEEIHRLASRRPLALHEQAGLDRLGLAEAEEVEHGLLQERGVLWRAVLAHRARVHASSPKLTSRTQ